MLSTQDAICANANCNAIRCTPRVSLSKQVLAVVIEPGLGCDGGVCTSCWFCGHAMMRVDKDRQAGIDIGVTCLAIQSQAEYNGLPRDYNHLNYPFPREVGRP